MSYVLLGSLALQDSAPKSGAEKQSQITVVTPGADSSSKKSSDFSPIWLIVPVVFVVLVWVLFRKGAEEGSNDSESQESPEPTTSKSRTSVAVIDNVASGESSDDTSVDTNEVAKRKKGKKSEPTIDPAIAQKQAQLRKERTKQKRLAAEAAEEARSAARRAAQASQFFNAPAASTTAIDSVAQASSESVVQSSDAATSDYQSSDLASVATMAAEAVATSVAASSGSQSTFAINAVRMKEKASVKKKEAAPKAEKPKSGIQRFDRQSVVARVVELPTEAASFNKKPAFRDDQPRESRPMEAVAVAQAEPASSSEPQTRTLADFVRKNQVGEGS